MKKFLVVLLSVLCLLTLVGCGNKQEEEDVVIKIGTSGPLTGSAAQYGNAVKEGAQIAVDEINALGGELQFELSVLDDEADGEKAANCYAQLVDWGMEVSMICVTTGSCLAVAQDLQDDGYFGMTPSGSNADIIANRDSLYRMCFADPEQGVAAAKYIGENKLATKVAAIVDNSSEYSVGVFETFEAECKNQGIELVSATYYSSSNNSNFDEQVKDAQTKGAELVFLPMYYQDVEKIIRAANAIEYAPVFFGVDGMDGILEDEGVTPELVEGVYYLTPFAYSSSEENVVKFVAEYNKRTGINPNQFAADGYDVVYAIYNCLVNGGAKVNMTKEELTEIIKAEIVKLTYDGLTGNGIKWQADGVVNKDPKVYKFEAGKLVSAN